MLAIALLLLSGCTYPHLLNLPSDGSGQALNSPFAQQEPQLSGEYLVFVSDRNGSQDVYLYDLSHRRLVDLPGLNAIDMAAAHPSVSADGRFIVFAASRQGRQDIYLYDRQIQYRRNLTDGLNASVRNPSISADGQRIAYESNASGNWDIVLCDRTGKPLDLSTPELSTPELSSPESDEKYRDEKSLDETLTKTSPERRATSDKLLLPEALTTDFPADDPGLPDFAPSALEKRSPDEVAPTRAIAPRPMPSPAASNDAPVTFSEDIELTGQQSDAAEEWDNEAPRKSASSQARGSSLIPVP